ncbi:hypothetical protein Tco_0183382 [Tanacetum coccineum]
MNYIPVRKENYTDSKGQETACDDVDDLDDQQFIVHGPNINPVQNKQHTADKEVPLSSEEQALHDELVSLMHQESLAKLHNDAQRNACEEEKKRIALDKGKGVHMMKVEAADYNNMDPTIDVPSTPTLRIHKIHPQSHIIGKNGKRVIGTKWVFRNKRDEQGTIVKNKARLKVTRVTEQRGSTSKDSFTLQAIKRIFSDYAGDNHDRRSTSGGCQYLGRRLVSWQCKKQTIVAISSTEAEYVAAASCCAQIQSNNEVLSYEEEMNFSIFNCTKEDSVGKPLYSRFTKTNSFKRVPHPLSRDYTPTPQEEIGSIGTSSEHSVDHESEISSVPPEVYMSTPITTNEKCVSAPKSKEVEPSYVSHIKTPRQPIKEQETPKVNRKNWNAMMEKELGEDLDSRYLPGHQIALVLKDRRPFVENTAQMSHSHAVKGNWGSAVKTSLKWKSKQLAGEVIYPHFGGKSKNFGSCFEEKDQEGAFCTDSRRGREQRPVAGGKLAANLITKVKKIKSVDKGKRYKRRKVSKESAGAGLDFEELIQLILDSYKSSVTFSRQMVEEKEKWLPMTEEEDYLNTTEEKLLKKSKDDKYRTKKTGKEEKIKYSKEKSDYIRLDKEDSKIQMKLLKKMDSYFRDYTGSVNEKHGMCWEIQVISVKSTAKR